MAKRGKNKAKGKPQQAAADVVSTAGAVEAQDVAEATQDAGLEAAVAAAMEAETTIVPQPQQAEVAEVAEPRPAMPAKQVQTLKLKARDRRSPFLVLADYEQRSLAHVAGLPEQLDAPGLWRGVAYRIGSHRLASGFGEVVEILSMPALTPVPGSQPWMLGVANVRGTLLPVVDLKQFLEGERTVLNESQRVLVVRQPGGDVAVTIDEMYGQRSFVDAQGIDMAPVAEGRYAHFIERAYRINDQDWGVFSLERLARTPEFRQAAA
jgi:twitching motility protein PilI